MTVFEKSETLSRSCRQILIQLILLVLYFPGSGSVTVNKQGFASGDNNDTHPICGTVKTAAGKIVTLREGISPTTEEFEILHVGTLTNAIFSPVGKGCAIRVCGFATLGKTLHDGYIGSTSDYMDCQNYYEETQAPSDIYNEYFNTSTIGCGCYRGKNECGFTCGDRSNALNATWSDKDCAFMFQESDCNSCYFKSVNISQDQQYTTDFSSVIQSLIVRDNCQVSKYSPAFKRVWKFHNDPQPLIYQPGGPNNNQVLSAFQSDPEYYQCTCGASPTPTPTTPVPFPITTTSKPSPPPNPGIFTVASFFIGLMTAGIVVTVAFIGLLAYKRFKRISRNRGSQENATNGPVASENSYLLQNVSRPDHVFHL